MRAALTTVLLLLLVSLTLTQSEDFLPGGVYVIEKGYTNQATLYLVGQSQSIGHFVIGGKTYSNDEASLEIITSTNATTGMDLQLSNGTLVRVNPGSEFRVDSFNQMVTNSDGQPETIKFSDYILNMAVMSGDAYVVSPPHASPNTMVIVQTPLANLELLGGKYLIKSSQKYVIAYVIDGDIAVLDSKTNKKEVVSKGQMAFVVPVAFPTELKLITTSKSIEPSELSKQLLAVKDLESSSNSVMFVVIDKKIVGVKVR